MGNLRTRLGLGLSLGIRAAFWYSLVEYIFYLIALFIKGHRVMLLQQWRGTVVIFVSCLVLGGLAGTLVAVTMRGPDAVEYRIRKRLLLGILFLFGLNAILALEQPGQKLALGGATLLIGLVVATNFGNRGRGTDWINDAGYLGSFGISIFAAWFLFDTRLIQLSLLPQVLGVWAVTAAILMLAILSMRLAHLAKPRVASVRLLVPLAKVSVLLLLVFAPNVITFRAEGQQPAWPLPAPPASAPNVVLVTLDTVTANHMGIYGYSRANTPHLRELLKESTFYANCIAAAPLTLTSHASIFTGLYPQSHGAYRATRFLTGRPLSPEIPTLAEVLSGHGYHTMAVAANRFYLSDEFGTLRGFHFVDWFAPTVLVSPDRDYLLRNRIRNLLRFQMIPRDFDSTEIAAETVNQRALHLLQQTRIDNVPFFLFLNYMDAHTPYLPPAPFDELYPGRDIGFDLQDYNAVAGHVNGKNLPIDPRAREHLISQYDGAIAYLDEKLGELIAYLKQIDQFDNTMIVITSDHGESFGDKNIVNHDTSVYQDEVHVPLIVKYPRQIRPDRVDALASHVDLMPTILSALGIKATAPMQGIDLRAGAPADRVVVAEMHYSVSWDIPRFHQIEWALYLGSQKMIYSDKGMRELYDLAADPGERHNLYRSDAPLTALLRNRMVNWSLHTTPRYQDATSSLEVEKRLESLGYAHQGVD